MDCPPDYSKYTLDKLLYVNEHLNREQYPISARKLDNEMANRHREIAAKSLGFPLETSTGEAKEQPLPVQVPSTELALEFHGTAREYFRIWIVNLCLTLLTFGIFSAWAKVRKKRYSYSHTTIAARRFSTWASRSRFSRVA